MVFRFKRFAAIGLACIFTIALSLSSSAATTPTEINPVAPGDPMHIVLHQYAKPTDIEDVYLVDISMEGPPKKALMGYADIIFVVDNTGSMMKRGDGAQGTILDTDTRGYAANQALLAALEEMFKDTNPSRENLNVAIVNYGRMGQIGNPNNAAKAFLMEHPTAAFGGQLANLWYDQDPFLISADMYGSSANVPYTMLAGLNLETRWSTMPVSNSYSNSDQKPAFFANHANISADGISGDLTEAAYGYYDGLYDTPQAGLFYARRLLKKAAADTKAAGQKPHNQYIVFLNDGGAQIQFALNPDKMSIDMASANFAVENANPFGGFTAIRPRTDSDYESLFNYNTHQYTHAANNVGTIVAVNGLPAAPYSNMLKLYAPNTLDANAAKAPMMVDLFHAGSLVQSEPAGNIHWHNSAGNYSGVFRNDGIVAISTADNNPYVMLATAAEAKLAQKYGDITMYSIGLGNLYKVDVTKPQYADYRKLATAIAGDSARTHFVDDLSTPGWEASLKNIYVDLAKKLLPPDLMDAGGAKIDMQLGDNIELYQYSGKPLIRVAGFKSETQKTKITGDNISWSLPEGLDYDTKAELQFYVKMKADASSDLWHELTKSLQVTYASADGTQHVINFPAVIIKRSQMPQSPEIVMHTLNDETATLSSDSKNGAIANAGQSPMVGVDGFAPPVQPYTPSPTLTPRPIKDEVVQERSEEMPATGEAIKWAIFFGSIAVILVFAGVLKYRAKDKNK